MAKEEGEKEGGGSQTEAIEAKARRRKEDKLDPPNCSFPASLNVTMHKLWEGHPLIRVSTERERASAVDINSTLFAPSPKSRTRPHLFAAATPTPFSGQLSQYGAKTAHGLERFFLSIDG